MGRIDDLTSKQIICTCTIASLKTLPFSPVAVEDTAIRAGPIRNFIAMATNAIRVPHAIMLTRDAMKRPVKKSNCKSWMILLGFLLKFLWYVIIYVYSNLSWTLPCQVPHLKLSVLIVWQFLAFLLPTCKKLLFLRLKYFDNNLSQVESIMRLP